MDDETLLRRLISAWRATCDPALEEAIDQIGALVATANSGEVDCLLQAPWPKDLVAATARVRALAALPPDPRISFVVAGVATQHRTPQSRDLHRAIAALLARAPSARLLPLLDVIEGGRGEMTHMLYADVRARIAAVEPQAADQALLDAVRARIGDRGDLDALWAQHVANPGDLKLRAVLADRLQEAGDPRGEFIALQLAGKDGAKLLARHIDEWTGPLPGLDPASRRFERGFLVAARLNLDVRTLALDRNEWVTLEELELHGRQGDVTTLVKRMPLLERLTAPTWAAEEITDARACPQLRALETGDLKLPDRLAFPKLEVFVCDGLFFSKRTITQHPSQLTELGLRAGGYRDLPVDMLPSLLRARGTFDLRIAISAWHLRVVDDRAELAFGPGRKGRALGPAIEEMLKAAGIRTIERKPRVHLLA